ncbi:unnamed protein product [Coregonus sp. 'balchen']|nr:unnamed protein product [Coregonus sp. 'balchen']
MVPCVCGVSLAVGGGGVADPGVSCGACPMPALATSPLNYIAPSGLWFNSISRIPRQLIGRSEEAGAADASWE